MVEERRRPPRPTTITGYLEKLPTVVLLNRIAIPMLAVSNDGIIMFANPACQAMLGHPETTLTGQPLNYFLHVPASASDSVAALREAAGQITTWQHARDGTVTAVVSAPLLMRAEDPILLVGLTDVTEWLWTTGPDTPPGRA